MCDSGFLLSGGVCVPPAECGCSFEGHYYHSGETVILDQDCGRRCSCSQGSMTCDQNSCGPHESCSVEDGVRGCRPIDQCASTSTCRCSHQGRYRQAGEQFWADEECQNLCTCNGMTGAFNCIRSTCGPQESCRVVQGEIGCHPNPPGSCSAFGDSHYHSFDDKAFDFQGTCRYVLATPCDADNGLQQFSVEARNEAVNTLPVSVTAEVFVYVWDYQVHISRDRPGMAQVSETTFDPLQTFFIKS